MANTLNLGTDGNWATKDGSLLGYNNENGNYKPLPFNFTRSTSATRVNKEGLIEVVSNNEPRIDFLNDSKGALLLEPSRSNYYFPSEGSDVTLTTPLGTFGFYQLGVSPISKAISYVGKVSISFIVKKLDNTLPTISASNGSGDIGVVVNGGSTAGLAGILTSIGNNYYKYTLEDYTSDGTSFFQIRNYSGNTTYVSLIQYENSTYATSYIPTQGSIGTRVAESCSQTPPSGIIGQTEGTVFLDFKFIAADGVRVLFTLDGGSNNKRIEFWTNEDVLNGFIGGSVSIQIGNTTITEGRYKAAIAYDELGNQAFYVNGVQIGVSSTPYTIANLDNLRFNVWSGGSIYKTSIKTNDVKIYNTRLSNAQLQALTS